MSHSLFSIASKLSDLLQKSITGETIYEKQPENLGSLKKQTQGKKKVALYAHINPPVFTKENPSPFILVGPTQFKLEKDKSYVGQVGLLEWHKEKFHNLERKKNLRSSVFQVFEPKKK